jgi:hypothetical protein
MRFRRDTGSADVRFTQQHVSDDANDREREEHGKPSYACRRIAVWPQKDTGGAGKHSQVV